MSLEDFLIYNALEDEREESERENVRDDWDDDWFCVNFGGDF